MLTYSFNIDDAIDYGVNTALVLNILRTLILHSVGKKKTGIAISSVEMYSLLPFLKHEEIDKAIQKAQEVFNKKGHLMDIIRN